MSLLSRPTKLQVGWQGNLFITTIAAFLTFASSHSLSNGGTHCTSLRSSNLATSHYDTKLHDPEDMSQQVQGKSFSRLALFRPFCPNDIDSLLESFQVWDTFPPCSSDEGNMGTDLVLVFSQNLETSYLAKNAVNAVMDKFKATNGWGACFQNVSAFGVDIPAKLDLYDSKSQSKDTMWVNGPNRQFEKAIRKLQSNQERHYDVVYLMEGDSVPVKPYWLDAIYNEIKSNKPFAILGSKYKGDKWDPFFHELPLPLIEHINGNAIYNISHPFLDLLIDELEIEAISPLNAVPYDYRIAQIMSEGTYGIRPEIPSRILQTIDGEGIGRLRKKEKFSSWIDQYAGENNPIKETYVIANYATTHILPQHLGDEFIIHGAKMNAPWGDRDDTISLVVSDWHEANSNVLLSHLDNGKLAFSEIVVMVPDGAPFPNDELTDVPVRVQHRQGNPDYMDLCTADISTEWFMITNSYHRVNPNIEVMVNEENKVVVPFAPANDEYCYQFPNCAASMKIAKEISNSHDKVVRDFDMVFETTQRNNFCEMWVSKYGSDGDNVPTATSFLAFLEAQEEAENIYAMADRTLYGARENFVKVLPYPISTDDHHRNLLTTNSTGCQLHVDADSCISDETVDCQWREFFGSCYETVQIVALPGAATASNNPDDSSNRRTILLSSLLTVGAILIVGGVAFIMKRRFLRSSGPGDSIPSGASSDAAHSGDQYEYH